MCWEDVAVQNYIHNNIKNGIVEWFEQAVRRGIPQGSPASSLIASFLLGPILKALPCGDRIVLYGDDFAIGAFSENEAQAYIGAFKKILKTHPVGPLELKEGSKVAAVKPHFEFVKYRYCASDAGTHRRPSGRSYYRYEHRLRERVLNAGPLHAKESGFSYMRNWASAFPKWDKNELSEILLELTTQQILSSNVTFVEPRDSE
jgi:hypothetical protein